MLDKIFTKNNMYLILILGIISLEMMGIALNPTKMPIPALLIAIPTAYAFLSFATSLSVCYKQGIPFYTMRSEKEVISAGIWWMLVLLISAIFIGYKEINLQSLILSIVIITYILSFLLLSFDSQTKLQLRDFHL